MNRKEKNLGRSIINSGVQNVSIFNNYKNPIAKGIISLSDWLLSDQFKIQIKKIREGANSKSERRLLKSELPCITPSGIFQQRCSSSLIMHSGFICIDIDGEDNTSIDDWEAVKLELREMPSLYYAGLSASGNGIYLIYPIEEPDLHLEHFKALNSDIYERGLIADPQCRDIARLRGASYDPNPYFNPNAETYKKVEDIHIEVNECKKNKDLTLFRVQNLVSEIKKTRANIAEYYFDWYAIGQSLASEFGENGRIIFHDVSIQSGKYEYNECNKQYDNCLKSCGGISIKTFFWYCKNANLIEKSI